MNHELEFVRHFIIPTKRERYLSLLESRKGRQKLLEALDHFKDLDMRRASSLPSTSATVNQIERLLKKKGAPDHCYITSSNQAIDGSEMMLRDALEQTVGQGLGTIISCIPGKLAYFEGEEPNDRYILHHFE
jgi:hypothetical protein